MNASRLKLIRRYSVAKKLWRGGARAIRKRLSALPEGEKRRLLKQMEDELNGRILP